MKDGKFKTLKEFTLEDIKNILKEVEWRQRALFEMKKAIFSLKCRLMDALSTIGTMKAEIKGLKECMEVGGSSSLRQYREAKVEDLKPPMSKEARDTQEVENFSGALENYFKSNKLKCDESKINVVSFGDFHAMVEA